jgi:hypothetical protein
MRPNRVVVIARSTLVGSFDVAFGAGPGSVGGNILGGLDSLVHYVQLRLDSVHHYVLDVLFQCSAFL